MGRQSFSVYLFLHHGNRSFTDATDDDFRTPSLERRQECCVRKQVNGNMTRSEESIILMMSYRLECDGNGFFAGLPDDVLT